MKRIFRFFAFSLLVLILCFQTVNACTVVIEPLRKSFRSAKAVFLAEVKEIKINSKPDYSKSLVDGEITFEISNSWKGNYKNRVTLPANIGWACSCSSFDQFKVGQKYVVFVDKYSVAYFCASEKADTEYGMNNMRQLDRFWFRTWARIYPF